MQGVVYFSMFDLIVLNSKDKSLWVYEDLILGLAPRGSQRVSLSVKQRKG